MKNLNETLSDRGAVYGDFHEIADLCQELKAVILTDQMTNVQREAAEMICHKLARIAIGDAGHRDSWLDIAGYAQLVVTDIDRRAQ